MMEDVQILDAESEAIPKTIDTNYVCISVELGCFDVLVWCELEILHHHHPSSQPGQDHDVRFSKTTPTREGDILRGGISV